MAKPVTVAYIAKCLEEAGFDPGEQLYGYYLTGNLHYITRTGNARSLITQVDRTDLKAYVTAWNRKRKEKRGRDYADTLL